MRPSGRPLGRNATKPSNASLRTVEEIPAPALSPGARPRPMGSFVADADVAAGVGVNPHAFQRDTTTTRASSVRREDDLRSTGVTGVLPTSWWSSGCLQSGPGRNPAVLR